MKRVLILFAAVCMASINYAEDTIQGGEVSGTWSAENSPYHIFGDLTVPENEVLKIEPGVEVIFDGHYMINVTRADLIAVGKPDSLIVFTRIDTTGLYDRMDTAGAWNGIEFYYSSESGDTSRLEYCRFEYCKKVPKQEDAPYGVIYAKQLHRLKIANCIFEYNHSSVTGVDCWHSDPLIRNNVFRNNVGWHVLWAIFYSSPRFIENEIRSNDISGDLISAGSKFKEPVIMRNLIVNNKCQGIMTIREGVSFLHNKILNNDCSKRLFNCDSENNFFNNLIANNNGTVFMIYGNSIIKNNTIVNNDQLMLMEVKTQGGEFNGNIFYGNTGKIHYIRQETEPVFKYNFIEGGISSFEDSTFTGIDTANFDRDPLFKDPTINPGTIDNAELADFGLADNSPALNRGDPNLSIENFLQTDLNNNKRIWHGTIDAGAIETHVTTPITFNNVLSDTLLVSDTIYIGNGFHVPDDLTLTIAGGARVIRNKDASINVDGTLILKGTKDDTILFTVSDTNGFALSDDLEWAGIDIINSNEAMNDNPYSEFSYTVIEYFKTINGTVYLRDVPSFSMNNCVFRNNRGSNQSAIGSDDSNLRIENCLFHNNEGFGSGGTINIRGATTVLKNNIFRYNAARYSTCYNLSHTTAMITGNLYHNNTGFNTDENYSPGSLISTNYSDFYMANEVIVNNSSEIDQIIFIKLSSGIINNSTLVNNEIRNNTSAGVIGLETSQLGINNSILYGNMANQIPSSIFLLEENAEPDLSHCLIEGGQIGIRTYSGFGVGGDFISCINEDPFFINPSAGIGSNVDVSLADWQLLNISPCINAGIADTNGFGLPATDFIGNERIQNERIDIGAYEKGGTPVFIAEQPRGTNLCTGDGYNLDLDYTNSDTCVIQWYKDGVPIPDANETTFQIDSARLTDEGNYLCNLTNAFGIVTSTPVYLRVSSPPKILIEPNLTWIQPEKALTLSLQAEGSSPMTYQWLKDAKPISNAVWPELTLVPTDSTHEGSYNCIISNSCGTDSSVLNSIYLAPQICMVTVSPTTGHNLVVWDKKTRAPILAYVIYRESEAAGIYDRLATVSFDDLSVFVDTTADPTVQAYLYKITAIDTAYVETDIDLCKPHKTIHLLVTTNPELNTTQLSWDRYYGFDYQTYTVYKSSTGLNFDPVHSMSASLNSWTDPDPSTGDLFYRIAVEKPYPCVPEGSGKKAGTGPYQHALSNMDDNKLKAGQLPPDTIILSKNSLEEENFAGTVIGKLVTTDADTLDSHTYKFVSGQDDDDNLSFTLLGDLLIASESFDYETKAEYKIRIRSTDESGNYCEVPFIIQIIDIDETTGMPVFASGAISVYPNPFSQETIIRFNNQSNETHRLTLTDLSGKIYRTQDNITTSEFILKREDLKSGLYFIELKGSRTFRGKIVIE